MYTRYYNYAKVEILSDVIRGFSNSTDMALSRQLVSWHAPDFESKELIYRLT